MRNVTLFVLINGLISTCLATGPGFEGAVNQAKSGAYRQIKNSVNQAKQFAPKTVFDNYTNSPEQTKYYGGIQQAGTEKMTKDVWKNRDSSEAAVISDSIAKRPNYVLHKTDKDIEHSIWLQSEAYNIVHGVTGQYLDCKPKEQPKVRCSNQYQNKQCIGAPLKQEEENCQGLKSSGCEQIDSVCIENSNGQCSRYQQTYRCPIKVCGPTTDVICGNGKDYCLDGSCTGHSYQASQGFSKSVSALSATMDAAKQLDPSTLTLFSGRPVKCSEKPVGYSNCCTELGWGQDAGLDHCPTAAKKLHIARDKKLAIKIGRYCSGPGPFPCIEHAQVFCVFSSKLAKIIEEQGRKGQLHLNFGSAKKPNCRGLTPEQLQAIDLSKIDFADFRDELSNRVKRPGLEKIQALIKQHVEQAAFQENAHV